MYIRIGLNHSELGLFTTSERLARSCVTIVCNLELSSIDRDDGANEELTLINAWAVHPLQEHSSVFQIVHINASITGVESQQVVSDEISLLVEPLGLENEPIL